MEVKIRNRSRMMQLLALFMFASLVWAYAQLEWGMPQGAGRTSPTPRGAILAADGSVLARTVGKNRIYPQGTLAGQIIGMMGDSSGLEGLEAAYNRDLESGQALKLTIDPRTQANAEAALAEGVKSHQGEYGSVVVIETRTGRVLAAASYPPFDPNSWRDYSAETRRNRPFLDVFEPGSTVKGLVVAAALNENLTTPSTVYDTPMRRHVGGRWGSTIGDAVQHPATLTTKQVLRYSSNVGMSHIVEHFPAEKLRNYLTNYGFGQDVQLPTVSAATGRLQPLRKWDDLVRATNAFGQGMSSTTLQLAAAYNTLANDGMYLSPRLVEGAGVGERREVIGPGTAREIRSLLESVVSEGIKHQAGIEGYALAGKTGTAQVVVDGKYSATVYDSTFAGFFPADAPRVTVAVMVHGAKVNYHGSMLAAPIYKQIASGLISEWGTAPKLEAPKPEPATP
ncbi:peptidoglycan D,D-transpeptidase FtsI family protein [Deinococcus gobiensis]|uniref:Peptidoglycan glycosyltransferase n=1 Tax=Deinococcus gobiensis (strain DSM 21396 / JCM 16679 / CGMCC 1.7299 / I-0) TaxID=745776 RepID=H8GYN4_DEIGI|nr:penicillin-binding protein 2 [Deinococcus gobiensis]AFD26081.1 Peptidoglycan glycosyltransferase [Deinococcus gobiensis I-0]